MTRLETLRGERTSPDSPEQSTDLRHSAVQTHRLNRLSARRSVAIARYSALSKEDQIGFDAAWLATQTHVEEHLMRRDPTKARPVKKADRLTSFMLAHSIARVRDTFYAIMAQEKAPAQCSAYALKQCGITLHA